MTTLPMSQLYNNSYLYAYGCQPTVASNTTLTISAGQVRDSTNAFDIIVPNALTLNFAANGANGLDTGTFAASTAYYVFVLFDETNANPAASLASLSATAPIMPTVNGVTYGYFRLVGYVRADGSTHLLPFIASGNGLNRYYQYSTPIVVLNAGTSATAADVSLATAVPGTGFGRVNMTASFTPNAANDTATIKAKSAAAGAYVINGQVASVPLRNMVSLLPSVSSSAATLTYQLSTASASLTLSVVGFEFNL